MDRVNLKPLLVPTINWIFGESCDSYQKNNNYKQLKENLYTNLDIKQKFSGDMLDPSWNVIESFPDQHIHIDNSVLLEIQALGRHILECYY